jgi:hypothetical protein
LHVSDNTENNRPFGRLFFLMIRRFFANMNPFVKWTQQEDIMRCFDSIAKASCVALVAVALTTIVATAETPSNRSQPDRNKVEKDQLTQEAALCSASCWKQTSHECFTGGPYDIAAQNACEKRQQNSIDMCEKNCEAMLPLKNK